MRLIIGPVINSTRVLNEISPEREKRVVLHKCDLHLMHNIKLFIKIIIIIIQKSHIYIYEYIFKFSFSISGHMPSSSFLSSEETST
ncbi:MAG: hypothetical protein RL059_1313 [Bacteroidota bacterium]